MAQINTSNYCATCQTQRMFAKTRINHVLHLILTIITAGFWGLFVWLPLGIINSARGARCTVCGMKQDSTPAVSTLARP